LETITQLKFEQIIKCFDLIYKKYEFAFNYQRDFSSFGSSTSTPKNIQSENFNPVNINNLGIKNPIGQKYDPNLAKTNTYSFNYQRSTSVNLGNIFLSNFNE